MFISIFQDVCNIFRAKQYPGLLHKFSLPIYLLFCFLVGLNKCQVLGHQRQHLSSPTKSPSECLYHYTCIYYLCIYTCSVSHKNFKLHYKYVHVCSYSYRLYDILVIIGGGGYYCHIY